MFFFFTFFIFNLIQTNYYYSLPVVQFLGLSAIHVQSFCANVALPVPCLNSGINSQPSLMDNFFKKPAIAILNEKNKNHNLEI